MFVSAESNSDHGKGAVFFDEITSKLHKQLTLLEVITDSPELRQALTHAELIISRIRAYYAVTQDNCNQAVRNGLLFASSLSNLTNCIRMGAAFQQSENSSVSYELPTDWVNTDIQKTLAHAVHLLDEFSQQVTDFVNNLSDLQHILARASNHLSRLFDVRSCFQRAYQQLKSAVSRAASASSTRPQSELNELDDLAHEAEFNYRSAAVSYLAHVRSAFGSGHLSTYLRLVVILLSSQHAFSNRISALLNPTRTLTHANSNTLSLLSRLRHLTNMIEFHQDDHMKSSKPIKSSSSQSHINNEQIHVGNISVQGYLFKRMKTWRLWAQRWFRVSNNQLIYCKRYAGLSASELQNAYEVAFSELCRLSSNHDIKIARMAILSNDLKNTSLSNFLAQSVPRWTVMESDLRFCTARIYAVRKHSSHNHKNMNHISTHQVTDRRFIFELISHSQQVHYLQAKNDNDLESWVNTLRAGLTNLQNESVESHKPYHILRSKDSTSLPDLLHDRDFTILNSKFQNNKPLFTNRCINLAGNMSNSSTSSSCIQTELSNSLTLDYEALKSQSGLLLWQTPDWVGNKFCADCKGENANWASINLGVTLCTPCASVHRSLGVHISKVRSLTLDNWQPELLHTMLNLGNRLVNDIYEANWPTYAKNYPRISTNCTIDQRRAWMKAKWVQRLFARQPVEMLDTDNVFKWLNELCNNWLDMRDQILNNFSNSQRQSDTSSIQSKAPVMTNKQRRIFDDLVSTLKSICGQKCIHSTSITLLQRSSVPTNATSVANTILTFGARMGCPPLILVGLVGGADPDWYFADTNNDGNPMLPIPVHNSPPLMLAIRSGSLAACELLLLNGANLELKDTKGRTALHYACLFGQVNLVCLFLRRNANQMIPDNDGKQPIDIAVELANADIVTLLRLQRLNESNKEFDCQLTDDIVTDVFRDFTIRSYNFNNEQSNIRTDDYDDSDEMNIPSEPVTPISITNVSSMPRLTHTASSPTQNGTDCDQYERVITVRSHLSKHAKHHQHRDCHNEQHSLKNGNKISPPKVITIKTMKRPKPKV